MTKLGIMQGRLSPRLPNKPYQYFPTDTWQQEFEIAAALGFDYIELIHLDSNMIGDIQKLTRKTGVKTSALCFDCLLNYPKSYTAYQVKKQLLDVIKIGKEIGLQVITLPYLEDNSLETQEDVDNLIELLKACSWTVDKYNIKLCLELDINRNMIDKLDGYGPIINITLDTGNNAYYGVSEYYIWVNNQHVHIKDRLATGESCLIGRGLVNWQKTLYTLKYSKIENFTLQGCRSDTYDSLEAEVNIVKQQLATLKTMLKESK